MNRQFSIYLDFVRFVAALLVYVYHSNQRYVIDSLLPFSGYGHSSVIVFFVLSGFVIAFVTETKENTWQSYLASRVARVFSVVVPAVILTVVLDSIGRSINTSFYSEYPFDQFLVRIGASLLMLNETWFISITSFSNIPFWSIIYEWWYYVIFAFLMFLPRHIGYVASCLTLILIGPKVLLLLPIWWLGVLLYRWRILREISTRVSFALFVLSLVGIVIYEVTGINAYLADLLKSFIGAYAFKELTFSKFFLGDYVLGLLVFMNFTGARNITQTYGNFLLRVEKPVRFVANFTFTLYLLHQPLFVFWATVINGNPTRPCYWLFVTVLTFMSIFLIGYFTERRRLVFRKYLFDFFDKIPSAQSRI